MVVETIKNSDMETLTTKTGRTLKVSSNKSKRHYTIITEVATYRTLPMTQEEFDQKSYNTGDDWSNFLKSDIYYEVR